MALSNHQKKNTAQREISQKMPLYGTKGAAPAPQTLQGEVINRRSEGTMPPNNRKLEETMPLYGEADNRRLEETMPLYGTKTIARADSAEMPLYGSTNTARADSAGGYQQPDYVQSDAVTQAQQALEQQQANKPGEYQSQWQGQLNDVLGQIQNRDPFQYDVNADALYQQAAQNYLAQGQQAMMDTMGQAAAMTGGYGNSYAQTAGQQTYNQHLQGLNEMVPQFQQMAMQRYQMEGDDLLNRYNMLLQQEETAYNRYRDDVSRYYADLDRLQSTYDSERNYDYSRWADDRDFDYGKYLDELNRQYRQERDQVSDDQWTQQWLYQQERDRIADEQWQKEYDERIRQYNETLAWQKEQAAAAAAARTSRSSGGGVSNYKATENMLANGGYNSAQMLQIIRTSPLSKTEQDKLVEQYQKPLQKQEVLKRDPSRDNSAWANR